MIEKSHRTTHKQNLASLQCDPSEARTHSGEMTSALERNHSAIRATQTEKLLAM